MGVNYDLFKKDTVEMERLPLYKQEKNERKMDFSRIIARMNELRSLSKRSHHSTYSIEEYSICHLFECEGFKTYEKIAQFCEEHHIKRVVDIGCAYGHQSEVFLQYDVDYFGVSDHKSEFWNKDVFNYKVDRYPCSLPTQKGDLGISVFCLTWNCYLYEGEKTLHEQCKALRRDFEHCLIHVQPNHLPIISKYFTKVEIVEDQNLYYFSNK